MSCTVLNGLVASLKAGSIRTVDLTQPLSADTPILSLPEPFGQTAAFKLEEISRYDERGIAWYWNNFTVGEHTGTHFDAPIHWVTGKNPPKNTVDEIDAKDFIAPAVAETEINELTKLIKTVALRKIVLPRRRAAIGFEFNTTTAESSSPVRKASIATGDNETIHLSFDMASGGSAPVN